MGITIVLETETGDPVDDVGDPRNLLHRLLPLHDDESYQCLRFIDWYGDTVFNQLQMPTLLAELHRLRDRATTNEERDLLERIDTLARRCHEEVHLYLKFYGD